MNNISEQILDEYLRSFLEIGDIAEPIYGPWIDEYLKLMMPITNVLEEWYGPWLDEYAHMSILCYFWPNFLMGNMENILPINILKDYQAYMFTAGTQES